MIAYRHPAFRPARVPARPSAHPSLGQVPQVTPGQIKGTAAGLGLVSAALTGAAAWVGIHTGLKERGLLSVAGWTVGLAGGLMGLMSLFRTLGILFTSDAEIRRAIEEAERNVPGQRVAMEV